MKLSSPRRTTSAEMASKSAGAASLDLANAHAVMDSACGSKSPSDRRTASGRASHTLSQGPGPSSPALAKACAMFDTWRASNSGSIWTVCSHTGARRSRSPPSSPRASALNLLQKALKWNPLNRSPCLRCIDIKSGRSRALPSSAVSCLGLSAATFGREAPAELARPSGADIAGIVRIPASLGGGGGDVRQFRGGDLRWLLGPAKQRVRPCPRLPLRRVDGGKLSGLTQRRD